MESHSSAGIQAPVVDMLTRLRKRGVRLWTRNGQLHYVASKGSLTQEELRRLRASRDEIVALLERTVTAQAIQPRHEQSPPFDCVPLTYSQLSHWRMYQLDTRRHLRQLGTATRLCGFLDVQALRRSLAEIARRHEALRTRIVIVEGVPQQQIARSVETDLEIDDLSAVQDDAREAEIQRRIRAHILEPIDITNDPLWRVRLLRFGDRVNVLLVAMEHIISDGYSCGILLRELFAAYAQAVAGRAFALPPVPVQFGDYAVWQRNVEKQWIEQHAPYWSERLQGCTRLRFPEDRADAVAGNAGWECAPVHIDRELRAALCAWCRSERTTLVMSVLTVYAALVLRWCEASEVVIRYQIDGRTGPEIQNTIGFFAAALHFRIQIFDEDRLADLIQRVTGEYCNAYQHCDSSYLEVPASRPDVARSTAFNWLPTPARFDIAGRDGGERALACSPVSFENPLIDILDWDAEPAILLCDTDDGISGGVYFPRQRFSADTMRRFARNFQLFLREALARPQRRVKDIALA